MTTPQIITTISSSEGAVEILSPDLLQITPSPGTLDLPNTGKPLLPFHLDKAYLLMPIPHLHKMLGIGGDRIEKLIPGMVPSNWLPDGISITQELDLRPTSHSVQLKKELFGSMKKAPLTLLQLLGRGTLTMMQLLLHSSLPVLSFLKTSTLRVLEATVSRLQEHLASAETLPDLALEVPDQATPPAVLPQVHLESEL
nr:ORF8b protein [Middle East respiratory syndrome-related coronavirus]